MPACKAAIDGGDAYRFIDWERDLVELRHRARTARLLRGRGALLAGRESPPCPRPAEPGTRVCRECRSCQPRPADGALDTPEPERPRGNRRPLGPSGAQATDAVGWPSHGRCAASRPPRRSAASAKRAGRAWRLNLARLPVRERGPDPYWASRWRDRARCGKLRPAPAARRAACPTRRARSRARWMSCSTRMARQRCG